MGLYSGGLPLENDPGKLQIPAPIRLFLHNYLKKSDNGYFLFLQAEVS